MEVVFSKGQRAPGRCRLGSEKLTEGIRVQTKLLKLAEEGLDAFLQNPVLDGEKSQPTMTRPRPRDGAGPLHASVRMLRKP